MVRYWLLPISADPNDFQGGGYQIYGFAESTFYVEYNVFQNSSAYFFILGQQNKISDSNNQMPHPSTLFGIEDGQKKSLIKEKLGKFWIFT